MKSAITMTSSLLILSLPILSLFSMIFSASGLAADADLAVRSVLLKIDEAQQNVKVVVLPPVLECRKTENKNTSLILIGKEECKNFSDYVCKNSSVQKDIDSSMKRLTKIYADTFREEASQKGLLDTFKTWMNSVGNPLLDGNILKTIDNYDRFFSSSTKQEVLRHATEVLAQKPITYGPCDALARMSVSAAKEIKKAGTLAAKIKVSELLSQWCLNENGGPIKDKWDTACHARFFEDLNQYLSKEKMQDYIKEFVVASCRCEFDQSVGRFIESSPEFAKKLEAKIFPPEKKKQIEEAFDSVLKATKEMIRIDGRFPQDAAEKFKKAHLFWPLSDPNALFGSTPNYTKSLALDRGAIASDGDMSVRVFGGLSDLEPAAMAFIVGHECMHLADSFSIDYPHGHNNTPAFLFENLKRCLADPNSTEAFVTESLECVADWGGFESAARWLEQQEPPLSLEQKRKSAVQIASTLCNVQHAKDVTHQSWDRRVNRIMMANPYFRQLLGCPPTNNPKYCTLRKKEKGKTAK